MRAHLDFCFFFTSPPPLSSANPQAAMESLAEQAQGDMRAMLGQLQMARLRSAALTFADLQGVSRKDADVSPFEVARRLCSGESAPVSIAARMDLVFQDADLVPLLIQARASRARIFRSFCRIQLTLLPRRRTT